jgi:hypothetical protein
MQYGPSGAANRPWLQISTAQSCGADIDKALGQVVINISIKLYSHALATLRSRFGTCSPARIAVAFRGYERNSHLLTLVPDKHAT